MFDSFRATYFSNATAVRDYRVQLRGTRPILLFGLYLLTLIGVAFVVYETQASGRATSVVQAQQMLRTFYGTIMALLGGLITLIAPALTATTIVQERQRQSFDLVFSAPVTPKYYLVGKVIASYRYVWMLLALSLPVTAASVVLGGAAWSDVLVGYVLLSLQALVFTSIALLMSTLAPKAVAAISWTYASIVAYMVMCSTFIPMMLFGGMRGREQSFLIALNPFTTTMATDTYTMLWGREIPNWVLALVTTLLIVRLILLGAGAILSPYGGREGRNLRLNGLAYVFGIALLWGLSSGTVFNADVAKRLGLSVFWGLLWLTIIVPFLGCFGYEGERVHWPNGMFKPKRFLDGTPASALPYVLSIIGVAALGVLRGFFWSSLGSGATGVQTFEPIGFLVFGSYLLYTVGFWVLMWSFARFASLAGNARSARTLQFALFLLLTVLPVPFLSALAWDRFETGQLWYLWVLYPLTRDFSFGVFVYGLVMLLGGWLIAVRSELLFSHKMRMDLVEDERLYSGA